MKRGEVWWAKLPEPMGRRPVILLSRDEVYLVRESITIAPLTTRIRNLPVEVALDKSDGLPKTCVANLDIITTVRKNRLLERICRLSENKMHDVERALKFALNIED